MRFFVKWVSWPHSDNSWVTCENIVNSVVFREYLGAYYKSLEEEIFAESWRIKLKIQDKIEVALAQAKLLTMVDVLPFDPLELKVFQVFYHLMTPDEDFIEKLEDLTFRSWFFRLDQSQQQHIEKCLSNIHEKGDESVTIENEEDFSAPPEFTYITKNIVLDDLVTRMSALGKNQLDATGCKCEKCSKFTVCCPQNIKLRFPYKVDGNNRTLLRLEKSKKIIECCELCNCPEDCVNKLTQMQKQTPMCLFMTKDKGWGVKARANIAKGTFVTEFLGELISEEETEARGRTTYMYGLNSGDEGYATIDAEHFGNLSRFINHSCDPNTGTWHVNDCRDEARNQRLW